MDRDNLYFLVAITIIYIYFVGMIIFINISVSHNQKSAEHTWTKGIMMGDKVCDFVVVCKGSEMTDLIYTGNCINISSWNGYQNKEWCRK